MALSDTLLQAPVNVAEITIQFSKDEHFTAPLNIAVDKNIHSRQFLCEELNSLLGRLGYEANEKAPLWIRIRSVLAANIAPEYSNVMEVLVQSYRIELVLAQVLDKDWKNTSMMLASPAEDGIYKGFMGVNGWENWWLREANNVMWGNLGEEGKTFYASSEDSHWNFWFPNPSGCYYLRQRQSLRNLPVRMACRRQLRYLQLLLRQLLQACFGKACGHNLSPARFQLLPQVQRRCRRC